MKGISLAAAALLAAMVVAACAGTPGPRPAAAPPSAAGVSAPGAGAAAAAPPAVDSATSARRAADQPEDIPEPGPQAPLPLWIDPADMGFGSSAIFRRIPTTRDLTSLSWIDNLHHVIISLPEWPADWDEISPLTQVPLPEGADLIVILPGYPTTHASAGVWNLLRRPLRIVMVVDGPPSDRALIMEMNAMRGLERVIVDMDRPSRSGFERLQRPLSFRVIAP